ncbi:MAG: hypothetical protein ACO38G_02440, partial [Burkholderiaceae bacterium]
QCLSQLVIEASGPSTEIPAQRMWQCRKAADGWNGRHDQQTNAKSLAGEVAKFLLPGKPFSLTGVAGDIVDAEVREIPEHKRPPSQG